MITIYAVDLRDKEITDSLVNGYVRDMDENNYPHGHFIYPTVPGRMFFISHSQSEEILERMKNWQINIPKYPYGKASPFGTYYGECYGVPMFIL